MNETIRADKRLLGVTIALVALLAMVAIVLLQKLLPAYLDYLRTLSRTDPDRLREEYERAFFGCSV